VEFLLEFRQLLVGEVCTAEVRRRLQRLPVSTSQQATVRQMRQVLLLLMMMMMIGV